MYKKSIFALTYKKSGWDCLRHYEILMNGCIPLFLDIKNCPINTISNLPKDQLIYYLNNFDKIFSFYNPFKIFKKKHLTFQRIFSFLKFNYENKNLEKFRRAQNAAYDLFNNGLGNKRSLFQNIYGWSVGPKDTSYAQKMTWSHWEDKVEEVLTPIILEAAKEQGIK